MPFYHLLAFGVLGGQDINCMILISAALRGIVMKHVSSGKMMKYIALEGPNNTRIKFLEYARPMKIHFGL
jgi:hypothetical protein